MIPSHPFACVGRDQGVPQFLQLMREWEELSEQGDQESQEEQGAKKEEDAGG